MKAMVLSKQGPICNRPLELIEFERPTPGPGQLLIKMRACGICRTDLHIIEGDLPLKRVPIIPGHQGVGVVVDRGPGCSRFEVGARVGMAWLGYTCGSCAYCSRGEENLCASSLYNGYDLQGAFAEFAIVNEAYAYRIPDAMGDESAAPLLCAGIIGYRALKRSELPRDGSLGIYGFGSSAHITAQVAKSRGARLFVATRDVKHQELARKLGAAWVGPGDALLPEQVDSIIVFAPAGELVPQALRSIRSGGTVAIAGIYSTPIPQMDYEACLFHEKNLRSVESNTRVDGYELFELAATETIVPKVKTFEFKYANEALEELKQGAFAGSGVLIMEA